MVDVDDRSSDQAANRKDQLGGKGGEQEDELYQRIEEIEAGGHEDPDPAEERSENGTDPQHEGSMRWLRAS